jgi:hypothetical protein
MVLVIIVGVQLAASAMTNFFCCQSKALHQSTLTISTRWAPIGFKQAVHTVRQLVQSFTAISFCQSQPLLTKSMFGKIQPPPKQLFAGNHCSALLWPQKTLKSTKDNG